jgi:hypothetical protein
MNDDSRSESSHLLGNLPSVVGPVVAGPVVVDTYAGPVRIEWDPEANVTPLGHFAFFVEYLKSGGRFDALVSDCPLSYASPNSPGVRNVLGTAVLGILAGHWRYAHLAALRGDTVSAELLGMTRVVSEDSVRRGLRARGSTLPIQIAIKRCARSKWGDSERVSKGLRAPRVERKVRAPRPCIRQIPHSGI